MRSFATFSIAVGLWAADQATIAQVQGPGAESPLAGAAVLTEGIVTGRKTNGFFIQTPDAQVDGDPRTSEGVFVFTSSRPPASANVGNLVRVEGTVVEFRPAADPNSPPMTELGGTIRIELVSEGVPLPEPVTIADLRPDGGIDQLERYEGMRVRVDTLRVVGPTGGSVNEADAGAASNGVFYGVLEGAGRPMREPGIEVPNPIPVGAGCCVPRYDANPERVRVDSDGQAGAPVIDVATGAQIRELVGPLDYGFRAYTILPDPPPAAAPQVTPAPASAAVPLPDPAPDQFTVATFNMQRFFDTTDDPGVSDVALRPDAFQRRLSKASLTIRNILRLPDILAAEEIENLSTLETIAARVNADAVAAGLPNPGYTAHLFEGNDPGGIDVGFLVKSSRVDVVSVTQEGKTAQFNNPATGRDETLNDRPPVVLVANIRTAAAPLRVTVIGNHLRSLSDIESATDGARVRAKRKAQAEFVAAMVQARRADNLIVVGDMNAYQFSDGLVDVVNTIRGGPAPDNEVVLPTTDFIDTDLVDAAYGLPSDERYSYIFDGNAQTLDHVLISLQMVPRLNALRYARVNADFPEALRADGSRPERLSDHDPVVAYFSLR
ncbi:MAG: endonuclease/exonuclease/phosphatase family protein [Bryobacterales bacterium]|nr:endonuclease/exonuclease/phosphatase family protein [Bryobacterales bacterium]